MNNLSKFFLLFIAVLSLTLSACHKDDHDHDEEELITTVTLTMRPIGPGDVLVYSWKDIDGPGGNSPVIPTITLGANRTYIVDMELLNESTTPAENITEEIQEESNDHLFVFTTTVPGLSIDIEDVDSNNQALGLKTAWVCQSAGSGTANIVLKHNPDKNAANPALTGSTDIDITFPVVIE